MSDVSALTCADCLVDPCGAPLAVNDDGCLVVPSSAVVSNGDGTATWAWVDGAGGFKTAQLITPDPTSSAVNILRGNGYTPENNADQALVDNTAAVTDLTGLIPAPGNTATTTIGSYSIMNATNDEQILLFTTGVWQTVQTGGSGSVAFDLYSGLRAQIGSGTPYDCGWTGQSWAGTMPSAAFLRIRGQLHGVAVVPAGVTAQFAIVAQLISTTLNAGLWSASVNNTTAVALNHTGDSL